MHKGTIPAVLACFLIAAAPSGEDELTRAIKSAAGAGNREEASRQCTRFIKQYPASPRLSELLAVCGDQERNMAAALNHYRTLVRSYPRSAQRAYAQLRICEIHFLNASWRNLQTEADRGLSLFDGREQADAFRFYQALATLQAGSLERAETNSQRIIEARHDPAVITRALLLLAGVHKKNAGFSRTYLTTLRDIVLGFPNSAISPTALYLMAEFYERRGDTDRAWSAYGDLIARYPRSPEAALARPHHQELSARNPSRVAYLPTKEIIDSTDTIDIQPDRPDDGGTPGAFYAVSVGPVRSAARLAEIRRLIGPLGASSTVKTIDGYTLLVGREPDADTALALRIRLAEEYGINGTIVRITVDGNRTYLYGE